MLKNFGKLNSNETGKKFEITGTTYEEPERGIAIQDSYDELARVLYIYSSGVSPNSDATARDFSINSDIFYGYVSKGSDKTGNFINSEIIEKVKYAFENGRDSWRGSWEYDGVGRFFKTSVEVLYDRNFRRFILKIYPAYVGEEAEVELANELGVNREIFNLHAELTLPEMTGQDLNVPLHERTTYRLDCEPIADALNYVIEIHTNNEGFVKPIDVAKSFMQKSPMNDDLGNCKLDFGNGIILTIGVYGGSRFIYPNEEIYGAKNLIDTRKLDGSTVLLPFPVSTYPNRPALNFETPRSQIRHHTISVQVGRESADLPFGSQEQLKFARSVIRTFVAKLKQ